MENYLDLMYPKQRSSYPEKLCAYLINSYFPKINNVSFLEIGCARGEHLRLFQTGMSPGSFHGVDFFQPDTAPDCLVMSQCDINHDVLPYPDNYFDIVFSKSVIEHVSNTDRFLGESYRVLKPGGIIVMMTPDWQTQMKNFYDDPTHVKPFTQRSLFAILKLHQFQNVRSETLMQLPITWKFPILKSIFSFGAQFFPENLKWKTETGRNTKDRKWIRFSKELMVLGVGYK